MRMHQRRRDRGVGGYLTPHPTGERRQLPCGVWGGAPVENVFGARCILFTIEPVLGLVIAIALFHLRKCDKFRNIAA